MRNEKFVITMFDNSTVPFCLLRVEPDAADAVLLYCNEAFAALKESAKAALKEQRLSKLFPESDYTRYYAAAYENQAASFDLPAEGLRVDCLPMDEAGLCGCLVRSIRQETEQRPAIRPIKRIGCEQKELLLDKADCGIVSYALPDHSQLYMNMEAMRVYGIRDKKKARELLLDNLKRMVQLDPADLHRLMELRETDGTVDYEYSITNNEGYSTNLLAHTEVITNPDGRRLAYTTFIDVSENRSLKNERGILNALCRDFVRVFLCDLEADTLTKLKLGWSDDGVPSMAEEQYVGKPGKDGIGHYSAVAKHYYKTFVDQESAPDFLEKMSAAYLMAYLPAHGGRFAYQYRLQENDSGVRNMEIQVTQLSGADGFQVVLGFRIIDDIIREEERKKEQLQAINTTLEKQNYIIRGLSQEYTTVWLVTKNGESCLKFQDTGRDNVAGDALFYGKVLSYTEGMRAYMDHFVVEEEREDFAEKIRYDVVLREIRKNPIYSVVYQRSYYDRREYFQISFTLADSSGESNDFVAGFKDVNKVVLAERRKNEALSTALAAAEYANHAKTQFLNNMSYDIRTPMNAIIGFTSLAASHLDNRELVKNYLQKIQVSSEHLLSLINEVLDMSRIESGRVKIDENPLHLPDLLHDIRTIIQPTIGAKRLDFLIDTVDVMDEDIIADKLRLTQVLLNILGNGVKFNKTGGMISLRVKQERKAPQGYACYHFIIRDTGIGIGKEFQEHIFENFSREQTTTVSGIQGTGLGLSITKKIVDMMGGTISLKSEIGVGSEFDVCLTFRLDGERKVYEKIDALQGLRVLVADDDTDTCLSISAMLTEIGMRSEWTVSGKEAVIRAKHAVDMGDEFYAYIIDWLMPDMNGIETVHRIRRVIGDESPIIILTAYDWSDVEQEAREAGVTAFCEKPLFMSELRDILSQPIRENISAAEPKPVSPKGKTILLVEDNELNQEIAAEILKEAGFTVEVADDGSSAVEKMAASAPGQYDLILMDIQMPILNGYEATRQIRAMEMPHCKQIPIIAMTANAFEEDRELAVQAGMSGYLAKPIEIDRMIKTIQEML